MSAGGASTGRGHPLKVLDITKFYAPSGGGVKTYLTEKRNWAAHRADFQHVVVLPGARDEVALDGRSRVYRIRGPRIPVSPAYRFLLNGRKLRRILQAERPDIIEVGSPFLIPWITGRASRGLGATLVGFYHCDIIGAYTGRLVPRRPRPMYTAAMSLTRRYVAAVYNRFAATIAATRSTAALLRGCGVERVVEVPLGVDSQLFRPERRDPGWRDELSVGPDEPLLLYAGRLCREKEVDVILRAVRKLRDRYSAVTVFVGEGHLRPAIERLERSLPRAVRWLEYQTDSLALARILASADVYLAPFSYETFGLSALEAMASGRPVVGSGSLALSDLLADENCGRTFRPGDADDLVRAVGAVLEAGPNRLGRSACERAREYSWERTFTRLRSIYGEASSGGLVTFSTSAPPHSVRAHSH